MQSTKVLSLALQEWMLPFYSPILSCIILHRVRLCVRDGSHVASS